MKTENTPEAKVRFFALYWGAEYVLDNGIKTNISVSAFMSEMIRGKSHLLLTPLSQISDEDAIKVGQWLFDAGYRTTSYNGDMAVLGKGFVVRQINPLHLPSIVVDFLRSRGYYVGDGTEIEYGWVKLKGGDTCKP